MFGVKITGMGCCLPEKVLTNAQLAEGMLKRRQDYVNRGLLAANDPRRDQFETSDDWIFVRSGIRERRLAAAEEATSDLAARAAAVALNEAGLNKEAVGFVLLATVSPDHLVSPPTAALVQHKLGLPVRIGEGILRQCLVTDITTACSSFLTALAQGYSLIKSGFSRAGLVIGADVMSRVTNPNDRAIYPLLGDGAGCFVLEQTIAAADQFAAGGFTFGSDGSLADLIMAPAGGSRQPLNETNIATITDPLSQTHLLRMRGREVFKIVVPLVAKEIVPQALRRAEVWLEEIDAIIFHQANLRMVEAVVERLGYRGIVYNNIERYGNTTSASIPVCFAEAVEAGVIKTGMLVLFVVFGGGISWGTALLRYGL